jgi:adenylate cyclase
MIENELAALASWIASVGLGGGAETALVEGFCGRAVAARLPLARAAVLIDPLHPIHEGRVFRWKRDKPVATVSEYGPSTEGETAEPWRTSPHYRLLATGESVVRRRVTAETPRKFSPLSALRERSITEFVAMVNRFSADGVIVEMDCFYTSWMTDRDSGFSDAEVAAPERLMPLPRPCDQVDFACPYREYAGRNLSRTRRSAVSAAGPHRPQRRGPHQDGCCGSATCGTTRASQTVPARAIIPVLNDYNDAIVLAIHQHSGDVLKLIGDGARDLSRRRSSGRAPPLSVPRTKRARRSKHSMTAAGRKACRRPKCVSGSNLAWCSTAT